MKKVVFILNAIQQQRCIKRIEEFIENGYTVEVYGFSRSVTQPTKPQHFDIQVIGEFTNALSYRKRIPLMYKAMKSIFVKYKNEDVLYYYFMLDVAIVGYALCKRPFVYENSDLMHTNMSNAILRGVFNQIDKYIIHKSLLTVMTSQGFVEYYYGDKKPENVLVVTNRLNKEVLNLPYHPTPYDINHLRFGFVGMCRDEDIFHFATILVKNFPQHEMHFFGLYRQDLDDYEGMAKRYPNFYIHGGFSNPQDLPTIYEKIDLIVAPYEFTKHRNHRYADANKSYDGIYFEKPLICSAGSFMGQQAEKMGIGFMVDVTDEEGIKTFIQGLTCEQIDEKLQHIRALDKKMCINDNPELFIYLRKNLSIAP